MTNKFFIVMILGLVALMISCAPTTPTVEPKEIEKLRVDYNRGKIEKIEDLIAIYKDPLQPIETRIAALQALGQTQHPDALKIMYDFMNQSVGVNYALLTATASVLMDNPTPENVQAMVNGLVGAQKKYTEFRTNVMRKLEGLDVSLQIEQLLNLFQAEKENYAMMEESLTKLMGSMSDDRVIPILIAIAKDSNAKLPIRSLALEILGKKRHPLITDTFIEMLNDPVRQFEIRDFALKAIGDIKEEKVILALLETLNKSREEYFNLVEVLTRAIGDYSDPAVIPALVAISKDDSYPLNIRKKALSALIKFKSNEAFDQLVPMMEIPENYVLFDEMSKMAAELGGSAPFNKLRLAARQAQLKAMETP